MRGTMVWGALWGAILGGSGLSAQAAFIPWDSLTADAWVVKNVGDPKLAMHTVNAGDYPVGFDVAAGNLSRGMNALQFSYGGKSTGHLASASLAGEFKVLNVGGSNGPTFKDLLVLVAIDAASLPADFAMSLSAAGQSAYHFDPVADFGYYDEPTWDTGRPSGYYSATSPQKEGVAYALQKGMVTVYDAQQLSLAPGGSVTFDYTFNHLPGTAYFSVYGYDPQDVGWIHHTNRAVLDLNQSSKPVSTFEVAPEPGTLALAALGMAVVLRRRSRCPRARSRR